MAWNDRWYTTAPILVLLGLVLTLGVTVPEPLSSLLQETATYLEASR
jgi:hypothetical protein